jgi:hypothetical protein
MACDRIYCILIFNKLLKIYKFVKFRSDINEIVQGSYSKNFFLDAFSI